MVKHTKWLRPDWKWWVGMTEQDTGLLGILFWWAEAYFLPTDVTWLCINLLTRTFHIPRTIPGFVDVFTSGEVHKITKALMWHFSQFNGKGLSTNFLIIENILDYIKAMSPYLYIYQCILFYLQNKVIFVVREPLLWMWYLNGDQILEVTSSLNVGGKGFQVEGTVGAKDLSCC